jgi:glutamine synthetase
MAITDDPSQLTHADLEELLKDDNSVKVGGTDIDGIIRGKLMSKKKFLSIAQSGFGFCSVIFGWDMHDQTYFKELKISNKENGYRDVIAIPDLSSFRRIPWENNVPFFLVSFFDPDSGGSLSACPRSLLRRAVDKIKEKGYNAMAGGKSPPTLPHTRPFDPAASTTSATVVVERAAGPAAMRLTPVPWLT